MMKEEERKIDVQMIAENNYESQTLYSSLSKSRGVNPTHELLQDRVHDSTHQHPDARLSRSHGQRVSRESTQQLQQPYLSSHYGV